MLSNPETMQQMAQAMQAMSSPQMQQKMMRWVEEVQERVRTDPELSELAGAFEDVDMSNMGALMQKLQTHPAIQDLAEQFKDSLGDMNGLFDGGTGGQGSLAGSQEQIMQSMKQAQDMMSKLMSGDESEIAAVRDSLAKMLPPETAAGMEQYLNSLRDADRTYKDEM